MDDLTRCTVCGSQVGLRLVQARIAELEAREEALLEWIEVNEPDGIAIVARVRAALAPAGQAGEEKGRG